MNVLNPYTGYAMGDQGTRNWEGPNVDPSDMPVPPDLLPYYRQQRDGRWAYVCPHCRHIFDPFWGGMPGSFREHAFKFKIKPEDDKEEAGKGCLFAPPKERKGSTIGLERIR